MFCRNCGNEIDEDSTFCNKCGLKVEIINNAEKSEDHKFTEQIQKPKKFWSRGMIVVAVIVGIILLSLLRQGCSNNKLDTSVAENEVSKTTIKKQTNITTTSLAKYKLEDSSNSVDKSNEVSLKEVTIPDFRDIKTINYKIIYTGKTFENNPEYYVLLDPIKNSYMEEIKKLVCKIVGEKGDLISIWFFDDLKVLKSEYNYWELGDDSEYLNNPDAFFKNEDLHSIAAYDGGNPNNLYFYNLWFLKTNEQEEFTPQDMIEFYKEIN